MAEQGAFHKNSGEKEGVSGLEKGVGSVQGCH